MSQPAGKVRLCTSRQGGGWLLRTETFPSLPCTPSQFCFRFHLPGTAHLPFPSLGSWLRQSGTVEYSNMLTCAIQSV